MTPSSHAMRGRATLVRCNRFAEDGSRCPNYTDNSDRWCRKPQCDGFLRPRIREDATENAAGSAPLRQRLDEIPVSMLGIDPLDIVVTSAAIRSYRGCHGGTVAQAELHLQAMVEDFALDSRCRVDPSTQVAILTRSGYTLLISKDRGAVVGYSTSHRERTWEQVKAGVKSRVRPPWRRPGPLVIPAPGPVVDVENFAAHFDAETIVLSPTVRSQFHAMLRMPKTVSADDLDVALRAEAATIAQGEVELQEGEQSFEVVVGERTWFVRSDCRVLLGVRGPRARGNGDVEARRAEAT